MDYKLIASFIQNTLTNYGFIKAGYFDREVEVDGAFVPVVSFMRSGIERILDCVIISENKLQLFTYRKNIKTNFQATTEGIVCTLNSLSTELASISNNWVSVSDECFDDLTDTERRVATTQRKGQDTYRKKQMELWHGKCALTGISIPELLVGSHAKAWADCETAEERLDPFNGFLFEARIDRLFDQYLISFDDYGKILISPRLSNEAISLLNLSPDMTLSHLFEENKPYLKWHRNKMKTLEPK